VILPPLLLIEIGQEPARVEHTTGPVVTHKCQAGLKKLSGKRRSSLLYSSVLIRELFAESKIFSSKIFLGAWRSKKVGVVIDSAPWRRHQSRWRHDIQYNDIQYNDIQYNDIQYNDFQYNDFQYNDFQYNAIQYNDTQHNSKKVAV
jgi:hypothetical protein